MTAPIIETPRLILRPLASSDAPALQELANAREIAENTLNIPHPYPEGAAEEFIARARQDLEDGLAYPFAIVRRSDNRLVGVIGLHPNTHHAAEIGYWVGRPYWGQGYATEAARGIICFGFEKLRLNRIYAAHFATNAASGRVLQKAGMTREGALRQHILKWGEFKDVVYYGILREEYERRADS